MDPAPTVNRWRMAMNDLLYVGVTIVFFALTWALVKLCERV
jgi:hypothetical protein